MRAAPLVAKVGTYFARATRLRCPVCGRTPLFPRAVTVRRVGDWFQPFDGCPRCGYAFEREPGYFLMAVWALNSGAASLLGLALYLAAEAMFRPPPEVAIPAAVGAVIFFNLAFVRHAKAYFIAMDHLLDPHERGGGDDRGNEPVARPPAGPAPGAWGPGPSEPCETPSRVR